MLTQATAELTIALMLALVRRVAEGDRLVRRREDWIWAPNMMLGRGLGGLTLGLVGHGRIGQAVERLAEAHGMEVVYTSRTGGLPLDELLASADVVSLHVPLSAETHHLIDERALGLMKPTAVLVNTSRGPIVDEAALARALADGRIAGAALDVFEREPEVHDRAARARERRAHAPPRLGDARDARGDGDALRRGAAGGAARAPPAAATPSIRTRSGSSPASSVTVILPHCAACQAVRASIATTTNGPAGGSSRYCGYFARRSSRPRASWSTTQARPESRTHQSFDQSSS